jgi:hypothetical protein
MAACEWLQIQDPDFYSNGIFKSGMNASVCGDYAEN